MTNQRTSIALSMKTKKKLHTLKTLLEQITRKNLDYDQVIAVLLCTKSLV